MKLLKNIPYKQQNKMLALVFVLFAFILYRFTVRTTLLLYNDCKTLENSLQESEGISGKTALLQKKIGDMEQRFGNTSAHEGNTQQALLGFVTNYCQQGNVLLREFPKTSSATQEDYVVETNVFVVEGTFTKLLKLIYLLEQKNRLGKIASAHFEMKKDLKTQLPKLLATVYLQTIKKTEHEK